MITHLLTNYTTTTMRNKDFKFAPNWDNDGMLEWSGEKTLDKYCTAKGYTCFRHYNNEKKRSITEAITSDARYFCFAFKQEDLDKWLADVRPTLKEGEKVQSWGAGIFCTPEGAGLYKKALAEQNRIIKEECDPQEVYCLEYNNYESCINYEGDEQAIGLIVEYFGRDVARSIKRYNAYKDI